MLSQLTRLLRGNRQLSTFLICAALSFVLLALPPPVKDAASSVVSGTVMGSFRRLTAQVVELVHVRDENASLRRLAAELAGERAGLIEYKHENQRLRELLSVLVAFSEEERFEMLPARVIGMPGGRIVERIEVDKGSEDGVRAGMPVVVPNGVVGKVVRIFPGRSLVEPLASASAAVSVLVERSRVRGIVRPRYGASSELGAWEIDYVPARSDIVEGDDVITSGLGGVFPAGLSVGTVTSVVEGPLTMSVGIKLSVDLSTIEQVFVLTGTTSSPRERTETGRRLLRELEAVHRAGSGD